MKPELRERIELSIMEEVSPEIAYRILKRIVPVIEQESAPDVQSLVTVRPPPNGILVIDLRKVKPKGITLYDNCERCGEEFHLNVQPVRRCLICELSDADARSSQPGPPAKPILDRILDWWTGHDKE